MGKHLNVVARTLSFMSFFCYVLSLSKNLFALVIACSIFFSSTLKAVTVYDLERDYNSLNARISILMDPNLEEFVFSTHILKLDHGGMLFLALLKMAAERGVKIQGITDRGIGGVNDKIMAYLKSIGLDIRVYNPIEGRQFLQGTNPIKVFDKFNRRLHDKGWVAKTRVANEDGSTSYKYTALTGDKNISTKYFAMARLVLPAQTTMNGRETVIEDSRVTKEIYNYFISLITENPLSVQSKVKPDPNAAEDFVKDLKRFEDWLLERKERKSEDHVANSWKKIAIDIPEKDISFIKDEIVDGERISTYKQILERLKKTPPGEPVLIENPYFVLEPELIDVLETLQKNGSKVTLLTSMPEYTDVGFLRLSFPVDLAQIASLGVDVYFLSYQNRITHAKMAVMGGETVYRGSANFDPRSLELNSESGEVYKSTALAEHYTKRFWTRVMTSTVVGVQDGKIFYDEEFIKFRKKERMIQTLVKAFTLGKVQIPAKTYTSFQFRSNEPKLQCRLFYTPSTPPKISIFRKALVEFMRPYL